MTRTSAMGALLAAAGAACAGAACTGTGNAQPAASANHGAAPMADQQTKAAPLLGDVDPSKPPPYVDGVVWAASIPADNAPTAKRIELGKKLYFETRLSKDGTVACATCHDVTRGFTDRRPASEGIGGKVGRRNAPTTLNAMLLGSQFWDGRAALLEDQAKLPITNPIEMGHPDPASAVAAIAGDPAYVQLFQDAYGRAPNLDDIGRALASFERTLIFLDAPFDRWSRGDAKAMADDAKAGFVLFNGKARCVTCHAFNAANPLGTDNRFHNIGVSARTKDFDQLAAKALEVLAKNGSEATIDELALGTDASELGRFVVSRVESDIGAFRTPQLRNIALTAPYMHDGSMQTLWDVVDHYNRGGEANHYLDGGIEPLALTEPEIDQLVAFMVALTDVRFADEAARLRDAQRAQAGKQRPFRDDDLASRRRLPFEPTK